MKTLGWILRAPDTPGISCDQWRMAMADHPALSAMEPVRGINPFTKGPMDYQRPHAAWVTIGGIRRGSIVWNADVLHVSGLDGEVIEVAVEIATMLGGVLQVAESPSN